jgi:GNAT superfamily N-acetyltransferase
MIETRTQPLRPFRLGDEHKIITLANTVYPGLDLGLASWDWRYTNNPAGHAIIELAEHGDSIAAHYALSPVILRVRGVDELTHLSLLTMTHADCRGRGLFPRLAERAYRRAEMTGSKMVWGFPNRASHRSFVCRLDWKDVYEIPVLRIALQSHFTFELSPNVGAVLSFDERFDRLWERVKDRYRYMVKRDAAYLQWRYPGNPAAYYGVLTYTTSDASEILGYVVFKRYGREYQIVDLLAQNVHVGLSLVQSVIWMSLSSATPVSTLSLWLNVADPLHHALEKMGFRNEGPATYFGVRPFAGCGWAFDFRDWYISMGDSDVF